MSEANIENVKDAQWIRIYSYDITHINSNLEPIPFNIVIHDFEEDDFENIYLTSFLEFNKITLSSKDDILTDANIIACKIPRYFWPSLGFAFKAYLPPKIQKIEFWKQDDGKEAELLYTKEFASVDEYGNLEPSDTYAKWFIYSIGQKLLLNDQTTLKETYCFENELHNANPQAHAKDIADLPWQIQQRSLFKENTAYFSIFYREPSPAKAQVVNGNLIGLDNYVVYLGNNIYDGTDEITAVASWAAGQTNSSNL